ncbi:MAG: aspartate kinase, partial [Clostridia bacterium]|nr:aspartate kinase [Clostridia bacterium]
MKVCKFGGTSMANGEAIERVSAVINSDSERKFIVVSAPGKRNSKDVKVTDALYACYKEIVKTGTCDKSFEFIKSRFEEIAQTSIPNFDVDKMLDEVKCEMERTADKDYAASRGEYMSARLLAAK